MAEIKEEENEHMMDEDVNEDENSSDSDSEIEEEPAEPWSIDDDLIEKNVPPRIVLSETPFDVTFHPSQEYLASCLINGEIQIWKYAVEGNNLVHTYNFHSDACRSIAFSGNGQFLFSASSDKSLRAIDLNSTKLCFTQSDAHEAALTRVITHGDNVLISGDDDGYVKVWDLRQKKAVFEFHDHEDFVADITTDLNRNTAISVGGDGYLAVYNMRKGKLEARSDNIEEEIMSVKIVKDGKKVVTGTGGGQINVWKWGYWGDFEDRLLGHPQSVDCMNIVDQDTILTGSSDGIIRIIQINPNQMLGVVGEHGPLPLERMAMTSDNKFLVTASHDMNLKFWDIQYLYEDDDEEEEEGEGEEKEEVEEKSGKMEESSSDEEEQRGPRKKPVQKRVDDRKKKKHFYADLL
eukprot:TRINITY_DN6159_c0_g1_i1.p1 TRINITY_DN6159_c0_g1~~TRINITY_DN6159_c0_g1_i1.p1  ORF type:complete len:406 (-),score=143.81 TRINITY_DN6159_c0_g1_i1:79-1296(-)